MRFVFIDTLRNLIEVPADFLKLCRMRFYLQRVKPNDVPVNEHFSGVGG